MLEIIVDKSNGIKVLMTGNIERYPHHWLVSPTERN